MKRELKTANLPGWTLTVHGPSQARANGISAFPTLVAYRDSSELGRTTGYKSASQVRAWLSLVCPSNGAQRGAVVGGTMAPDGKTEIAIDLPGDLHCKNVSSRGEGCCVQTSINHSARWQNVPALVDFQRWVQEKKLPGGAGPDTVDNRIP